jgi:uncharacterized membrane protein YfcA
MELASICAALGVGFLIGTAGVGGVLLAPWLTLALGQSVQEAMAVAMIAFMGPGLLALWRARAATGFFPGTRWLVLATLPGALLGAGLLHRMPNAWALWLLAGVVFLTGLRLWMNASGEVPAQLARPGPTDLRVGPLAGLGIGLGSALTVTGGPLLLIPLLLSRGALLSEAIALGQLVQLPISGGATLANAWSGPLPWASGLLYGALMLPAAWLGMRWAPRLPRAALSRLVAVLMLVSSAAAAWKAMT